MKHSYVWLAVVGVGLGAAVGCSAQGDGQASAAPPAAGDQSKIASATMNLENAFATQFKAGHIDREALQGPINDVVNAMPVSARAKVQEHIDQVIKAGQDAAATMSPQDREKDATPPDPAKVGHTEQYLVGGYGWPGYAGWGGLGAFNFPGAYYGGYGTGYGTGYGYSTSTSCVNGFCYSTGPYGYGGYGYLPSYAGWYW